MVKEYEKDLEDYKKIKEIYESSLTEQQKDDIKRVKEEMAAAKEKRKLKSVSNQDRNTNNFINLFNIMKPKI